MRVTTFIQSLAITGLLFVNANCKKQLEGNTAPTANAGEDITVILPANSCQLRGYMSDKENNIVTVHWRDILDTLSYFIHTPGSLETTVSNLELGTYQFELKVTDIGGLISKDTCTVIVGNTLILKNLTWIIDWYPTIEVKNFTNMGPQNSIKIYIKRDSNPNWIEVSPSVVYPNVNNDPYQYGIQTLPGSSNTVGSLYIYYFGGGDGSDTPDLKIEF